MMKLVIVMAVALLATPSASGQDLPQWVLNLSRLKRKAAPELSPPDFTCHETFSRFDKSVNGVFKAGHVVRVEAARIGREDRFAPEGGTQFEAVDLSTTA